VRDRDIYQRFTHRRESILELVEAYGLTEQHIYRIIAEQRALHVRRVQHALPLD
jgi:Mor family transcriptional regulator